MMNTFTPRGSTREQGMAGAEAFYNGRTVPSQLSGVEGIVSRLRGSTREEGMAGAAAFYSGTTVPSKLSGVEGIVARLAAAKAAEDEAKAVRVRIEQELASAVGVPEAWTGSRTSDIGAYKVTCKRPEAVKVDADQLVTIFSSLPVELVQLARACFRWKPELDKKAWDRTPDQITEALAPAITRTPGKIGFSLKLKEQN